MKRLLIPALSLFLFNTHAATEKRINCNVVEVNEDIQAHVFEDGIGSVYDIDTEGNFGSDEDAVTASIETHRGKTQISLGQFSFGGKDVKKIKDTSNNSDIEYLTYKIQQKGEKAYFILRYFKKLQLGVVLFAPGRNWTKKNDGIAIKAGEKTMFLKLDCRPGVDLLRPF